MLQWWCIHVGKVRDELQRRKEGKRLCRGRVVDNLNDCGKHQICQSFTECENLCSKIELCEL